MPVVAVAHAEDRVRHYYRQEDLDRLAAVAEVRILGTQDPAQIGPRLGDVDIITSSWGMPKLSAALLAQAPRLKAACYAAGSVKGFVTPEAFARGLIITTAMHANAIPVAEVTVALITLANKNWFLCLDRVRSQGRDGFYDKREPRHPGNYGTTVGIVGFGAVGRLVVGRLQRMDLRVLVADPHATTAEIRAAGAEPATLLDLARRSQVVSLHAPDIPACTGMIDAAFLAAMPDGACFINTARGRLVDEAALLAELRTGRISAHLDVTHPEPPLTGNELYALPNCWLTPHRAGSSASEVLRLGHYAINDAIAILRGEEPQHRVLENMLSTMA